jgi:branched-chain amino acid transport system substrate-binding protein
MPVPMSEGLRSGSARGKPGKARWRAAASVTAVLLLGGVLVACSSSSKSSTASSSSSSTGASTPATTGSASGTINIGFVCSCSGPGASSTAVSKPAYQAWESATNAAGGINGHQVHVIYDDDQANPGTGLSDVESLISSDHVVALVDVSNTDTQWSSYAVQHGVPIVGGTTSGQLFVTSPDFFSPGETLSAYFANFVQAAQKVGAKSIAEFYCAESVTCLQAVAPLKAQGAKDHVPLVDATEISASAPSYAAQCLAAKQAGAGALVVADAVSVVESVAKSCEAQGYDPYEIALDGAVALSFTSTPGLKDKLIGSEPNIPFFVHNAASAPIFAALQKYQPSVLSSPNYGEEVTQAYISGMLFADAAKAGKVGVNGPPTAAQVLDGLYSLQGDTLGGTSPPLTFKGGQPNPINCWYWIATSNGQFTTPYGTDPVCVDPATA